MICCCDVDGVLADFVRGACVVHGDPNHTPTDWDWFHTDWGISATEFWRPIKEAGENFYRNYVPPLPWKEDLLGLLREHGDVVLATANPLHPGLAASKIAWLNKHVPGTPVMMGCQKELMAKPGRILVDDNEDNLVAWLKNGGHPIRMNQPWNLGRNRIDQRMEQVIEHLGFYTSASKVAA